MRSMNVAALALRAVLWVAAAVGCVTVARDDLPSVGTTLALAAVYLVLTCIPGLVFLVGVRSWPGTVIASLIWIVGWAWILVAVDASREESSTAGIGLVVLPMLFVVPLGVIAIVEWRARAHDDLVAP